MSWCWGLFGIVLVNCYCFGIAMSLDWIAAVDDGRLCDSRPRMRIVARAVALSRRGEKRLSLREMR